MQNKVSLYRLYVTITQWFLMQQSKKWWVPVFGLLKDINSRTTEQSWTILFMDTQTYEWTYICYAVQSWQPY